MLIQRRFTRKSAGEFDLREDIPQGWIAVSHRLVSELTTRREVHGEWVQIASGSGKVYRILQFLPVLRGKDADDGDNEIVIDWRAWLELIDFDEKTDKSVDLTITPVKWWTHPKVFLSSVDPNARLAAILALISLAISLIPMIYDAITP